MPHGEIWPLESIPADWPVSLVVLRIPGTSREELTCGSTWKSLMNITTRFGTIHRIGFASLSLLLSGIGGCKPDAKVLKLPPTAVTVAKPLEREVYETVQFNGRTDGSEFVDVRARVSGYLKKVHFKPGTLVKEGDPLFEIDERPYAIALEQAEGELDRVNARLKRVNLDIARAEGLLAKKVMAREDYDRLIGDQGEAEVRYVDFGAARNRLLGVERDEARALTLLRVSAEQGSAIGQLNLGLAYVRGMGVEQDLARAIEPARRQLGLLLLARARMLVDRRAATHCTRTS